MYMYYICTMYVHTACTYTIYRSQVTTTEHSHAHTISASRICHFSYFDGQEILLQQSYLKSAGCKNSTNMGKDRARLVCILDTLLFSPPVLLTLMETTWVKLGTVTDRPVTSRTPVLEEVPLMLKCLWIDTKAFVFLSGQGGQERCERARGDHVKTRRLNLTSYQQILSDQTLYVCVCVCVCVRERERERERER